jgi:hypothetical protein
MKVKMGCAVVMLFARELGEKVEAASFRLITRRMEFIYFSHKP